MSPGKVHTLTIAMTEMRIDLGSNAANSNSAVSLGVAIPAFV